LSALVNLLLVAK